MDLINWGTVNDDESASRNSDLSDNLQASTGHVQIEHMALECHVEARHSSAVAHHLLKSNNTLRANRNGRPD
jgi:hypothetical protein